MCGIAGFLSADARLLDCPEGVISRMTSAIESRGPDDEGSWSDAVNGIALGQRRLSIIDLSPAGHQPMHSSCGRFVLVFNGEIYNHNDLRAELTTAGSSPAWKGHSDTETLLECFSVWGLDVTIRKTVGMFALALWDKYERKLFLVRDRFGEKPLYYGWAGSGEAVTLIFGSELKALRALPGFDNPVDRDVLALYMQYGVVPSPYAIYRDIYKLEAGCIMTAGMDDLRHKRGRTTQYWRMDRSFRMGLDNPILDESVALELLDTTLRKAVALQMVADVSLGAFLSGGIDSSLIVALMQSQSSRPVETFTVGFDEMGFDESPHARRVSEYLGTHHHEMKVTSTETREVIPLLPCLYDEPFADSSQIPTFLVCRAARRNVTVALSGDGGDELFGGYNRYFLADKIWSMISRVPALLRKGTSIGMRSLPVELWDRLGELLPRKHQVVRLGDKIHKLASHIQHIDSIDELYVRLLMQWPEGHDVVNGACRLATKPADRSLTEGVHNAADRMMLLDGVTYLPDDILAKVDRAAMGISLETRVPFLDHRVAELAWRIPLEMKVRDGRGKWLLRQLLYRYVPKSLIERPKAGFGIPVGQWLRGPLRDWAEGLLDEKRLREAGYLNSRIIQEMWHLHLSGRFDLTDRLWTVLMFQAWLEKQR